MTVARESSRVPSAGLPRLAVFEFHHLGDAVMAIPFLRGARAKYRPVVVCGPRVAELLGFAAPWVETVGVAGGWAARLGAVVRDLRLGPRDACACVWPDPRVHALMWMSGAGVRAGFAVNRRNFYGWRPRWRARRLLLGRALERLLDLCARGHVLTPPLDKATGSQHHLESWRQLARSLGFEPDMELPWIPPASAGERSAAPRFVVHAGARLPTKRWPVAKFEELLREYFAPRGIPVTICRFRGEPAPVPMGLGQSVVDVAGFEDLHRVLSSADAVLCNDSFPGHFAAALGRPVVSVFGSGEPAWFAPHGSARFAVCSHACPHRPCLDRCVMPSFVCLESIQPRDVVAALDRLLADFPPRARRR